MNDSADIKIAADRLQEALRKLETSLDPLLEKVGRLEKVAVESEDFTKDRAKLARELDASAAREKEFEEKEAEFSALADETTSELERVIRQVQLALGRTSGREDENGRSA